MKIIALDTDAFVTKRFLAFKKVNFLFFDFFQWGKGGNTSMFVRVDAYTYAFTITPTVEQ